MFKFFTSDLRRNLIKILCLSVGLAIGMLLVAKLYFIKTYDEFFPNADRLYLITESFVQNGEYKEYKHIPGGISPELMRTFPQIGSATRFTVLTDEAVIKLEDGRKFDVPYVTLADSCFFDVLGTPIVEGNPHEVLNVTDRVMIPRSLAEKIGGDVIGMTFSVVEWSDNYKMTVGGVYEDYPINSTITNAVYLAMPTITSFMWDGSENLLGNDRYNGYALLDKDTKADDLHPKIVEHLKTKIPEEAFSNSGFKIWLRPISGEYISDISVKTMSWLLGMLVTVILVCAGLNYLLIVIGQLAYRGKEMAIRKCFGTSHPAIFRMMLGESLLFLFASVGIAVLIDFSFSNMSQELLGYDTAQLFALKGVWWLEGLICSVLLIFTGVLPAVIYCRTPLASAFRFVAFGRRGWKLILLAVQFFASGLVLCLLVLVGRQYSLLGNLDTGMEIENVAYFYRYPLSDERTYTVINELKKLPFVKGVSTASNHPVDYQSGNNIYTEGHEDNNVNIADYEFVNPEFFSNMGIRFVQGTNFSENTDSTVNEVIVEERMIEVLQKYFDETGEDIIGNTFYITGHSDVGNLLVTVVGVVNNIRRGSYESERADTRAGVFFPSRKVRGNVFIQFAELTPENLNEAQKVLESLNDGEDMFIIPYKTRIEAKRAEIRRFGSSVMVVGIAIMLIALIGLIGYVSDEVNRRAKEIAIRKVNGTSASKIVRIFCVDVLKVALPSLILGGAAAMIIGHRWLAQFTDRVSLSPLSMVACLIMLLIIIMGVVILNTLMVARGNPINHLRTE